MRGRMRGRQRAGTPNLDSGAVVVASCLRLYYHVLNVIIPETCIIDLTLILTESRSPRNFRPLQNTGHWCHRIGMAMSNVEERESPAASRDPVPGRFRSPPLRKISEPAPPQLSDTRTPTRQ
jgi:hypothetical protein